MATPVLALQDICVQYSKVPALQLHALAVEAGEILAIMGPNGAGKSTLLRIMGLLQRPTRGRVFFCGCLVTRRQMLRVRRRLASVLQEPLLLKASVYDNAALGLTLRGVDRRTIERQVTPWLERFGIAHLRQRPVHSLSGGEAQRTSLVRALVLAPKLLLLDEPFAALDPPSREALLLDLERILRETGITTVFVTHERHDALTLGDRVVVVFGGALVQLGTPWEVFSRPATEDIAHFVGADINLPGTVQAVQQGIVQVTTPIGTVEAPATLPPGSRVTLCLRPEDLILHRASQAPPASSARNLVSGTIAKITPWGVQARVLIDSGMPLTALVTWRSLDELGLQPGQEVLVAFKASAVHVIHHHDRGSER
jgi:tungstate transport system ATP-binding protein